MNSNDANEAYRDARERLDKALNQINHCVRAHGARQFRDRENWGLVGDIKHAVDLLNEVIEFLGGERVAS